MEQMHVNSELLSTEDKLSLSAFLKKGKEGNVITDKNISAIR